MSVYEDILEWSGGLPAWQRDALRRIVTNSEDEDQIAEIEALALREQGVNIAAYQTLQPDPLNQQHLPLQQASGDHVCIHSISEIQHVNLLDSESTLTFSQTGLTVIYGGNGSGKSGYIRLLKKLCRTRDKKSKLLPNVYDEATSVVSSAKIGFSCSGNKRECEWQSTTTTSNELAHISIFDSKCADVYVNDDNEVAYSPFGLDTFPRLGGICGQLRSALQARKDSIQLRCPKPPTLIETNSMLIGIYPATAGTQRAKIDSCLPLTQAEKAELLSLKQLDMESDTKRASDKIRINKSAFETAIQHIKFYGDVLGTSKLQEYKIDISSLKTAEQAAAIASSISFSDLLPGTGNNAWKELWRIARAYSLEAYPGKQYPNIEDGAKCVLCQQTLDEYAKSRFLDFDKFVNDKATESLNNAKQAIARHRGFLAQVPPSNDGVTSALSSEGDSVLAAYNHHINTCKQLLKTLDTSLSLGDWTEIQIPVYDSQIIKEAIANCENEIQTVLQSQNAAEIDIRRSRISTLECLQWVNTNKAVILEDIEKERTKAGIDRAHAAAATTNISNKSRTTAKQHVSDELSRAIIRELNNLNANQLQITLHPRGDTGVPFHKITLNNSKLQGASVSEVMSEGEFRAIALAAFLGELSQSPNRSAIVVDDPVCSLDHNHREKVARRLCTEAVERQVIVFTHDVFFLRDLISISKSEDVSITSLQLTRGDHVTGRVCSDAPWDTMLVSQRIGKLRNDLQSLTKVRSYDHTEYENQAKVWYGQLREAWEVSLEEVVFNSFIMRSRISVETNRLKSVCFTSDDYDMYNDAMSKSSHWLHGHAAVVGDMTPCPMPNELESDLKFFDDYIREVREKQKPVKKIQALA